MAASVKNYFINTPMPEKLRDTKLSGVLIIEIISLFY